MRKRKTAQIIQKTKNRKTKKQKNWVSWLSSLWGWGLCLVHIPGNAILLSVFILWNAINLSQVSGSSLHLESCQPYSAGSAQAASPSSRLSSLIPELIWHLSQHPPPSPDRLTGPFLLSLSVGGHLPTHQTQDCSYFQSLSPCSLPYQYITSAKCVDSVLLMPLKFLIKQPKWQNFVVSYNSLKKVT